jgi:hypothetical protein
METSRFNGLGSMPAPIEHCGLHCQDEKTVETLNCDECGAYTGLKAGLNEKRAVARCQTRHAGWHNDDQTPALRDQ